MTVKTTPRQASLQLTLDKIQARMDKLGDLPIFGASVNRIRMMSASEETEVTEFANEISKDASLTTKLLRVSNSPYYLRNNTKVGTASRAVVMLGFDTVRNITLAMKVIDSFQYKHPQINMTSLLVKSYLSAGFVREIAFKCGAKDPEETYTCGLLHNMGEIILAVTLPDEYLKMVDLVAQEKLSWEKAQLTVLGTNMNQIAQEILKKWEFPNQVTSTVVNFVQTSKGTVRNSQELNCALASFGSHVMDSLYTPHTSGELDYEKMLQDLQEISGLRGDVLTQCLNNSFKMSVDLADQYGLDKKVLKPKVIGAEDDNRNKTARKLAYMVSASMGEALPDVPAGLQTPSATGPNDNLNVATSQPAAVASPAQRGDMSALINILHDITMMITQHTDINAIFGKILEGMQQGVGFENSMLCLLTPDRARYKARFAVGPNAEALKKYFTADVNVKADIFSRVTMNGEEVLVKNANDERLRAQIKTNFVEAIGATTFVVASLKLGDKSIGFFYGDTSRSKGEITSDMYRGFIQLVSQARIALSVRK